MCIEHVFTCCFNRFAGTFLYYSQRITQKRAGRLIPLGHQKYNELGPCMREVVCDRSHCRGGGAKSWDGNENSVFLEKPMTKLGLSLWYMISLWPCWLWVWHTVGSGFAKAFTTVPRAGHGLELAQAGADGPRGASQPQPSCDSSVTALIPLSSIV